MLRKTVVVVLAALALFIFFARRIASTVRATHTFNAPVEKVWSVFTDPEMIKRWWGPGDYTAPAIKNDLRVGGRFLFAMRSPKGELFWSTGIYQEVVPDKRIVSTLSFADETGKALAGSEAPVPGRWPDAITVTTEFSEVDGKTKVAITEVGIPLIVNLVSKMGWHQQFEKLEPLLNEK